MQWPYGGRKYGEKADEAGSQKTKHSMVEREAAGVSRYQTRQGFGDHVKICGFFFYPKSHRKLRKDAKEGKVQLDLHLEAITLGRVEWKTTEEGEDGGLHQENSLDGRSWKTQTGLRETQKWTEFGAPGWLSQLNVRLLISNQVLISGSEFKLCWAPRWA